MNGETIGLLAATLAAMLWATATVLYASAGRSIPPIALNAAKGVAVTLLFGGVLLAGDALALQRLTQEPATVLLLLALSGVVGITVGDSGYFAAVNPLGPRRTSLLSLLAVPLTSFSGVAFLGEDMGGLDLLGIALTLGGVSWVVAERPKDQKKPVVAGYGLGVGFGLLAAVGQAAGATLNRAALLRSDLDPLATAFWRLGCATVLLVPLAIVVGDWRRAGRAPRSAWLVAAVAALLGTFGGIWLQQVAFDRADSGPVQALLSTTPVWILPIAAMSGDRVTGRAVAGALVAVSGAALLLFT